MRVSFYSEGDVAILGSLPVASPARPCPEPVVAAYKFQLEMPPPTDQIANAGTVLSFIGSRELDLVKLSLDVWILNLRAFNISQDLFRFLDLILLHQPPGRLRQPRHRGIKNDNEYELQRERDAPCHSSAGEGEAICDPVAEGEAGDVEDEFNYNELSSPRSFTRFCLPRWGGGVVETVAYASYDAANNHLRHSIGCDLKDGADRHDGGTEKDRSLSSKNVSNEVGQDGAEEAANVVYRCYCAEERTVVPQVESIEKVVRYNHASKNTLIIAE